MYPLQQEQQTLVVEAEVELIVLRTQLKQVVQELLL
jgi:hypothetical protein